MASDEYSVVGGGGALKLKGAKVHKKKKKRDKSDLEKNLGKEVAKKGSPADETKADGKVDEEDEDDRPAVQKTDSEKRHEEIKRKRLLQMAESSGSRPDLLKTHKERVEELNTYLSRLSEHHDMPRIGPG
ncbi:hypothetical protein B0J13DRAFT_673226 [Dactylonectria estremocensis]|uniref:DUF1754-domain-containing protein n=1 Tax=Dactylonectria estremocensis TaxID=1079267 RepID=A0A9P9JCJ8_9HYPO|nr:hypothetical protein B0J13DRAFT_673226 [Dactylonectria estremocensis]